MQVLTIAGNVGKDAVKRTTQGGDDVLSFSVAVNNGKDKEGNNRPATWFDCSLWGKRASSLEPHIRKGDKIAVTGRPTTRAHEGKAYLGLTVDQLTFQGSSARDGGSYGGGGDDRSGGGGGTSGGGYGGPSDVDDEIPF